VRSEYTVSDHLKLVSQALQVGEIPHSLPPPLPAPAPPPPSRADCLLPFDPLPSHSGREGEIFFFAYPMILSAPTTSHPPPHPPQTLAPPPPLSCLGVRNSRRRARTKYPVFRGALQRVLRHVAKMASALVQVVHGRAGGSRERERERGREGSRETRLLRPGLPDPCKGGCEATKFSLLFVVRVGAVS
jgi:hypothetical protein